MNILSFTKLSAFIVIPVYLLSTAVLPANTNFSGQWKLNESKSDLGDFGARFTPTAIKIDQTDASITTAKQVTTFNGDETTRTETLTFDGKAAETEMGFGNSKRKATASWSQDGKALLISYTLYMDFNGQSNEIPGKETLTLSEDGKTLTYKTEASSPQGDFTVTAVYDKQ